MTIHEYRSHLHWSGSTGAGYRQYARAHTVELGPEAVLQLSADKAFRGDPQLANPEQLLVAATSSCQLLAFLAVAARAGVDVVSYDDEAEATMPDDIVPVRVTEIVLRPRIRVRGADRGQVEELVARAHDECYVASSLRTDVRVAATIEVD